MAKVIDSSNLGYLISKIKAAFLSKTDAVTVNIDNTPTKSSNNFVKSGGVYSEVHPEVQTSIPAGGMLPNVFYNLGTLSSTTSIVLSSASDSNIENEYKFAFDTSSTTPQINWPANKTWTGNCIDNDLPSISASKHYEVSIIGSYGIIIEF